jgi:hypothetical protein
LQEKRRSNAHSAHAPSSCHDACRCWRCARSCSQKIVVTLSVPTGQSLQTQSLQVTLSQVQDGCVRAHGFVCARPSTLRRCPRCLPACFAAPRRASCKSR